MLPAELFPGCDLFSEPLFQTGDGRFYAAGLRAGLWLLTSLAGASWISSQFLFSCLQRSACGVRMIETIQPAIFSNIASRAFIFRTSCPKSDVWDMMM